MPELKGQVHRHNNLTDQELIEKMTDRQSNVVNGDLLVELANRYLPMVKSFAGKFYVRGMEFNDWKQEAKLVIIRIIKTYDTKRQAHFGSYYRSCFRNHIYDVIRRENAQKRIPNNRLTSYSTNQSYYDDILGDVKASHPENAIIFNDQLKAVINRCSNFERNVLIDILIKHRSISDIAKHYHCSISKVNNASERYRLKYNKMRDSGLD